MNILKKLRENQGLTPRELAKVAGINVESYYDLESYEDEIDNAVSLGSVARIANKLGVKPSILFGGTSERTVSTKALASSIREHLARSGKALAEFESQVGYKVTSALADPDEFGNFNADGLRAVCAAVDVNWLEVLDHVECNDGSAGRE